MNVTLWIGLGLYGLGYVVSAQQIIGRSKHPKKLRAAVASALWPLGLFVAVIAWSIDYIAEE